MMHNIKRLSDYDKWHQMCRAKVYNAVFSLLNSGDDITFEQVALISKVPIKYITNNKELRLLIVKYMDTI